MASKPAVPKLSGKADLGAWIKDLESKLSTKGSGSSLIPQAAQKPASSLLGSLKIGAALGGTRAGSAGDKRGAEANSLLSPLAKVPKLGGGDAAMPPPLSTAEAEAAVAAAITASMSVNPNEQMSDEQSKLALWGQVFATYQGAGKTDKAIEYASAKGQLEKRSKDLLQKYTEAVAAEEQLFQAAYQEAVVSHQQKVENDAQAAQEQTLMNAYQEAVDLQVQAQQQVEAQASMMQAELSHQQNAAAKENVPEPSGFARGPPRLPRRPGVAPCGFYMRTGECAYGFSCKSDHPDRDGPVLNIKGLPIRQGEPDCSVFMKTGNCKFGAACRWNHPEARITGMGGGIPGVM